MPIFKGFEKQDETLVAVVDFPNAKKHTPYFQEDGSLRSVSTPFPHEERLSEDAFKSKFAGMGFSAINDLPFREEGHDLRPLLDQHLKNLGPVAPSSNTSIKPSTNLQFDARIFRPPYLFDTAAVIISGQWDLS